MPARVAWSPAQLALFEANKLPRTKRKRFASEMATHVAVADMLRKLAMPGWWWSTIPSGEMRTETTGALLKRLGLKRGIPDFLFIGPSGTHRWMELKRAGNGGRLSPDQLEFQGMCIERGISHAVVRGFAEAEAQLREWHVLRPDVSEPKR